MKLNWRSATALLAVQALGCVASSPQEEPSGPVVAEWAALSAGPAEAVLSIQSDWKAGYCSDITLKNNGNAAVTGWTVVLDLHQSTVSSSYSSKLSGSTFTPESYNASIAPGGSTKFGFCANATGADYRPTIASFNVAGGGSGSTGSGGASATGGSAGSAGKAGANSAGAANAGGGGSSSGNGGSTGTGGACPTINGTPGWTSRFWDCCKPHCGWSANVSGGAALSSCSANNQSYGSNYDVASACSGGSAYMCYGLTPWAVSSTLAYGYAATPTGSNSCGKCYEVQFTGAGHSGSDPGSAALKGKTMIVQSINVGGDVASNQFDVMVPGGGVGAFNACSSQWGVSNAQLGEQYGGLLATCKKKLGYNASAAQYQACLRGKCNGLFTDARGLGQLRAGCLFYVDWFQAADNPQMVYKEVSCPAAIQAKSNLRAGSGSNNACGG